jgi:hypothetical protein
MATFKVIQHNQPNVDIKMPSVRMVQKIGMGSHNPVEKFYRPITLRKHGPLLKIERG